MREDETEKKVEYPYIPALWLSAKPAEWEPGKKRTPLGWMTDEEIYMTKVDVFPGSEIGGKMPRLRIGAMMDKPGATGSRIKASKDFATWERARKRFRDLGY